MSASPGMKPAKKHEQKNTKVFTRTNQSKMECARNALSSLLKTGTTGSVLFADVVLVRHFRKYMRLPALAGLKPLQSSIPSRIDVGEFENL